MNKGYCSISYNSNDILEKVLYGLAEKGIIGFDYAVIKHNESEFQNPHYHFWINVLQRINMEELRSNFLEYKIDAYDSFPIGYILPFKEVNFEVWYKMINQGLSI